jgi:hypothetical protein
MEGSTCYYLLPCDPAPFEMPLTEYGRDSGCAVIGGVVARGDTLQTLSGWYLFGDYCEGTIFGVPADAEYARNAPVRSTVLLETGLQIAAFGQAPSGEVYVADIIGGAIYVIEERQ